MKPTLLTIWPRAFDFPIWRELVEREKDKFEKIVVVCTNSSKQRDLRPFFKEQMPYIEFIDIDEDSGKQDWYDEAVNIGLARITSDWVLFLEQDFWFREGFIETILNRINEFEFVCYKQGSRLHLAFFLGKKEMIDKTLRYFSQVRDRVDCFDLFTMEMQILANYNYKTLEELGFQDNIDFHHLNGLTQNTHLLSMGLEPNSQPEEFKKYCKRCLEIKSIHPDFKGLFKKYVQ